jgi:hypothetical protein
MTFLFTFPDHVFSYLDFALAFDCGLLSRHQVSDGFRLLSTISMSISETFYYHYNILNDYQFVYLSTAS